MVESTLATFGELCRLPSAPELYKIGGVVN